MDQREPTLMRSSADLKVKVLRGEADKQEYVFNEAFNIGRDESCSLQIKDHSVSRIHAEVYRKDDCWWIRDLNSSNGTLVDGRSIDRLPLTKPTRIELGSEGPVLSFEPELERSGQRTIQKDIPSVTEYQRRYFDKSAPGKAGQHTIILRQAFQRLQRRQKRAYHIVIAGAVVLVVLASGFAYIQSRKARARMSEAIDLFYSMKSLEIELSLLRSKLTPEDLTDIEARLDKVTLNYDDYVRKRTAHDNKVGPEERIIVKMARVFGECELRVPPLFVTEVRRYIDKWKASDKLGQAVQRAQEGGYIQEIVGQLEKLDLPREFFYLAVQESELKPTAVGPETDYGFAKGMWQFIPDTALDYGLRLGPLWADDRYDPSDERHDWRKSTEAAARYIRDIYDRMAQASGLLVMACYNWSETKVKRYLQQMPQDPRERNFWLLLEKHEIPTQTYDYIFYIFSAAVIGDNPRLFDFDFDNPLAGNAPGQSGP